jgi:hypothetical protein
MTTELGFSLDVGGAHTARTIMLDELRQLLETSSGPDQSRQGYRNAIVDDNVLGKRSEKSRVLSFRHLVDLYGLDPALLVFRGLVFFWNRDPEGRPLLAILSAYARDALLRQSANFILGTQANEIITRVALEHHIETAFPERFSPATLKSTAQNINSSWTKAGHLTGRNKKIRSRATPTPGSAAYAVFLGFLSGGRGLSLFETEYAKILDCPRQQTMELSQAAASKGWITTNQIHDVFEVSFSNIIGKEDLEKLREQN